MNIDKCHLCPITLQRYQGHEFSYWNIENGGAANELLPLITIICVFALLLALNYISQVKGTSKHDDFSSFLDSNTILQESEFQQDESDENDEFEVETIKNTDINTYIGLDFSQYMQEEVELSHEKDNNICELQSTYQRVIDTNTKPSLTARSSSHTTKLRMFPSLSSMSTTFQDAPATPCMIDTKKLSSRKVTFNCFSSNGVSLSEC